MTRQQSNGILLAFGLIVLTASPSLPQDITVSELMIYDVRARATPPKAPVAGGYLTIMNTGSEIDRLIGVSAPFAGKTEIHEIKIKDDVVQMRRVDGGVEIPANGSVQLKPGGLHIMFMQLKEQLVHGEHRSIILVFERHGNIEVVISIEDIGKQPKHSSNEDTPKS